MTLYVYWYYRLHWCFSLCLMGQSLLVLLRSHYFDLNPPEKALHAGLHIKASQTQESCYSDLIFGKYGF